MSEVAVLPVDAWVAHFNAGYHNGGWSGVALRSTNGDSRHLFVGPAANGAEVDTVVLARCPSLVKALAAFACTLRAARLLRLMPGGNIDLHRDPDLGFDAGEIRLHVALTTNPGVEFYVDGELVIMMPGECWYLDLSRPHRVANKGTAARIHLVIDAIANDWLLGQISNGDLPPRVAVEATGASEFERFRQIIFDQPALAARLRLATQTDAFVMLSVELGQRAGCNFAPADVSAAITQGRHTWITQWIV